jgi:hypothetical protein
MVLTDYFVLSPAIRLSCHRHRRMNQPRLLDANLEASGPHDFAVRFNAVRQGRIHVHRIPFRVRDDREPPLWKERDGVRYKADLGMLKIRIFLQKGLDSQITDLPVGLNQGLVSPENHR